VPSPSTPHAGPSFTTFRARADTLESDNLVQEVPTITDSEESDAENSDSSSELSYKDPAEVRHDMGRGNTVCFW
jgi:hypothetical protein